LIHELKLSCEFFVPVLNETKRFEIRKDDRGYKVDDVLRLMEYDRFVCQYTGREVHANVRYILDKAIGLDVGYVVMSIEVVK
jgi:hypothetical protein